MNAAQLRRWLDSRLGLSELAQLARGKRIPIHRHSFWYYFGGMTLFLFLVQAATGILLVLYYRPSPDNAYESIRFIMSDVPFGWLVRSIHAWGANLMILALLIHFFSVLLVKSYRSPREATWLSGMLLLALALAFGFTGYLLPWNQLSFFATRVGTEMARAVPLAGDLLVRLLRGGDQVSAGTVTRFYGIHVAILPALTTALLALHVLLVQKHGMSLPVPKTTDSPTPRTVPFYPNYLLRDAVGWLAAVAALAALAAFFPAALGTKADPFAPAPKDIHPEWYFLAVFQTLKMLPAHVLGMNGETLGIRVLLVLSVVVAIVPLLDRKAQDNRPSRGFSALGWAIVVYLVVFTILGRLR